MPRVYPLAVTLGLALGLGPPAKADWRATAGQWKWGAVADARGRFSHCAMEGPSFLATCRIDDEETVEGRSTAVARGTVVIAIRGSPRHTEVLLRRGRVLRLSVDDTELALALDDSARALNKLNNSVATSRAGQH
jgi:hypothetical protein